MARREGRVYLRDVILWCVPGALNKIVVYEAQCPVKKILEAKKKNMKMKEMKEQKMNNKSDVQEAFVI